jgi:hypothetical protein
LQSVYGDKYNSKGKDTTQSANKKFDEVELSDSQRSPVKFNDIMLDDGQDGNFMMNSINETNNEINAHVSKLEISGDEQIESDREISNRKKFM